jgi:hypothetical protein
MFRITRGLCHLRDLHLVFTDSSKECAYKVILFSLVDVLLKLDEGCKIGLIEGRCYESQSMVKRKNRPLIK